MDLGIAGRKAIVCASSQGLGRACALALAREGAQVVINGRDEGRLEAARKEIRALTGADVSPVVANLNHQAEREKLLGACPEADILVNNNAGPPPGLFENWGHEEWLAGLEANLLAPVMMIRGVLAGMRSRRFGRIVNITSAMVKSPHPVMGLSTAARSGLTAVCKGLSKQVAPDNVTINNLLPERIDTERQVQMANLVARGRGISLEEARAEQIESIAAKRLGRPEEVGDACAFLCSAQAGFISGQNLQLDGGSYDGLI
jgi:3-oxoacyl-[acyl-carrier protein] reductase